MQVKNSNTNIQRGSLEVTSLDTLLKGKAIVTFEYLWKQRKDGTYKHHTFRIFKRKAVKSGKTYYTVGVLSHKNTSTNNIEPISHSTFADKREVGKKRRYHQALTIFENPNVDGNGNEIIEYDLVHKPIYSKFEPNDDCVLGFTWVFNKLKDGKDISDKVKFSHEGFCIRCGRHLTDPESVRLGTGPQCGGRIKPSTGKRRRKKEVGDEFVEEQIDTVEVYLDMDVDELFG